MTPTARLAAFAGLLAIAFAVAFLAGGAADPIATGAADEGHAAGEEDAAGGGHADDAGHDEPAGTTPVALPGLAVSQSGYTLVPTATSVRPGAAVPYAFTITGPDGSPVTDYVEAHERDLHLIVVRRDLDGFQHVHPTRGSDGTWTVPLDLAFGGVYRVFADFQPAGLADGIVLGADLFVSGAFAPTPLPEPAGTARVGGYEVALEGAAVAGETADLTFTVTKDGRPVTDLQPYLGAYGHLVSLRVGDLAYLHTHPAEEAQGSTPGGPQIAFAADFPTAGTYRMFLDFKVDGQVRTAEFTIAADGANPSH